MTETEWLRCADSWAMLGDPERKHSTRQWNLILCGISRSDWLLLKDERSRKAVEVAELHEDGLASRKELEAAHDDAVLASMAMEGKEKPEIIRASADDRTALGLLHAEDLMIDGVRHALARVM